MAGGKALVDVAGGRDCPNTHAPTSQTSMMTKRPFAIVAHNVDRSAQMISDPIETALRLSEEILAMYGQGPLYWKARHLFGAIRRTPPGQQETSSRGGEIERRIRVYLVIRRLRDGGHSLRQIVKELNDGGIPAIRGGRWAPGTVSSMLRRGQP